ncbi:hypothetical protein MASR2M17_01170 [Aminivibrio sp.]
MLLPGGRLVAPLQGGSGSERLFRRIKEAEGVFVDSWHECCRFVPLLKGGPMGVRKVAPRRVIAGAYIAVTLLFAPLSYGMVQIRISEA